MWWEKEQQDGDVTLTEHLLAYDRPYVQQVGLEERKEGKGGGGREGGERGKGEMGRIRREMNLVL